MRRSNFLWLLVLVAMASQLVYLLVSELRGASGNPWLEVNIRPNGEMIVAVPAAGQSPAMAADSLTRWVLEQGGTVSSVQAQGQGRVVMHSQLAQHRGGRTELVLQLAPLRNYDPSLRGIRLAAPRFLHWALVASEGISIGRGSDFMGSVLTASLDSGSEPGTLRVELAAPLWPLLALLLLSLAAGALAYAVSQILRLRSSDAGQTHQYLGQIIPAAYVVHSILAV